MPDKKDIAKAGAVSGASAVLPYVAVVGGGLLAYKFLKDDAENLIVGGGRVIERTSEAVKEIVNNTTDTISTSTTEILDSGKQLNDDMNDDPVLKYFAIDIQNPDKMANTQKTALSNYKKGNISEKTVAAPDSLYNKIFGGKMFAGIDNPLKNWFFTGNPETPTDSKGEIKSLNVADIKSHEQAVSMGLGLAPLSVNANPVQGKKSSIKDTKSIKAMPKSNLKNATSVKNVKDKNGVTRKRITYKKNKKDAGKVTLRY